MKKTHKNRGGPDTLSHMFNELLLVGKYKKGSDACNILSPLLFSFVISVVFPRQAQPTPAESNAARMGSLGKQHPNKHSEPRGGRSLAKEGERREVQWGGKNKSKEIR